MNTPNHPHMQSFGHLWHVYFAQMFVTIYQIKPGSSRQVRLIDQRNVCVSVCARLVLTHSWWRHQDGNIFRATVPLCGNSPVTGEFPAQTPMTRSFDVFFDLRLNKRLSKNDLRRHRAHYDVIVILGSSHTYMRHYTGPSLVLIMTCRLFGAKPLSEPLLTYCQLDSKKHISVKMFHWKIN